MPTLFDEYSDTYREQVQQAIGFVGQKADFFTEVKATCLIRQCQRLLGEPETMTALDIGCGVGLMDEYLIPRFRSVCGVDVSASAVDKACQRNPGADYRHYDGDRLPFDDGSFDVTFAAGVMHHVDADKWLPFVSEMRRVLRPGGIAVVFEHNPFNPLTRRAVNRCPFDEDAVLLSRRRVVRLFRKAELNVVRSRYILFFPWRGSFFRYMEWAMGWLPLGGQHYVIGRK